MKIMLVAGARPNFMKVAAIIRALESRARELDAKGVSWKLVHTGQHYDDEMSKVFLDELEIPEPDYFFKTGAGTHAEQTANIMVEFEKVCIRETPDLVLLVGDVNSTLACSIVAKKQGLKVAHVEAGLRSRDTGMPEEINRIVTDSISDLLFVSEKSGLVNLRREGREDAEIFFVGNVMIDTLYYHLTKIDKTKGSPGGTAEPYCVVTLHRPSNVDFRDKLEGIIGSIIEISREMPVLFPAHPRTKSKIESFGLADLINGSNVKLLPPLPYVEFLCLWKDAALVLTDSGGIQEETTALGVPCFTIRENTERPVTIEEGTNTLVGTSRETIMAAYKDFRRGDSKECRVPELWDGKSAERIVSILMDFLAPRLVTHNRKNDN